MSQRFEDRHYVKVFNKNHELIGCGGISYTSRQHFRVLGCSSTTFLIRTGRAAGGEGIVRGEYCELTNANGLESAQRVLARRETERLAAAEQRQQEREAAKQAEYDALSESAKLHRKCAMLFACEGVKKFADAPVSVVEAMATIVLWAESHGLTVD